MKDWRHFFEVASASISDFFERAPKKHRNEETQSFPIPCLPPDPEIDLYLKGLKPSMKNPISDYITHLYAMIYIHFDAWQEGKGMGPVSNKWLLDERNKKFFKIMIQETTHAQASISFTVGFHHLLSGDFPLISELNKYFPLIEKGRVIEETDEIVWETYPLITNSDKERV